MKREVRYCDNTNDAISIMQKMPNEVCNLECDTFSLESKATL